MADVDERNWMKVRIKNDFLERGENGNRKRQSTYDNPSFCRFLIHPIQPSFYKPGAAILPHPSP